MVEQTTIRMTAAEYFELPETTQITELLNGELLVSPTPVPKHQRSVFRTAQLLDDLIPHGEIFIAPMSVYLDTENIPEPDIIWVSDGGRCVVGEKYLEGPPDLIVEVFSPSTARRNKDDKYELYQRIGVLEYWMIDPDAEYIEVFRLEDGQFVRQGVYGPNATFLSQVLGNQAVDCSIIFSRLC